MVLIVSISGDARGIRDLYSLSSALAGRGHSLSIFFTGDGVRHLREEKELAEISSMGVRLLACRTSVRERGIALERSSNRRVEISSLSILVELIEACDRVIFL